MKERIITSTYLSHHPLHVFVFGDNKLRRGTAGAAKLRYLPNTYGFITQKYPSRDNEAHYHAREYEQIYKKEIEKLRKFIKDCPVRTFLISRVGGGLANQYRIWQKVIQPNIRKDLGDLPNVEFLWEE